MSRVFVVSPQRSHLAPCTPARARWLLTQKQAAVLRRFPLTIVLLREPLGAKMPPLRLKIDPGSTTTGLAVVNDATGQVVWAGELTHRGQQVREGLQKRRACRRSRRQRHTRYRPRRLLNRRRNQGWLPPSLESRLANVLTWVARLQRWCPLGAISLELVKFDTQLLQNPEISGVAYQRGELAGYEVRQYLNLTIACHPGNQAKGNRTAAEFGHPQVQVWATAPLKDAAAVNTTRLVLYHRLQECSVPLETGSGGRTKYNRPQRSLPKSHWVDASCVGASTPSVLLIAGIVPLLIGAERRHSRQMCRTNGAGFPDKASKASSVVGRFRTGDLVQAVVPPSSVKAGTYVGRIAVRATGSCNLQTATRTIQGIHYRYCRPLQRADGYTYAEGERAFLPAP